MESSPERYKEIAQRLKEFRTEKCMTQKDFSDRCMISQGSLSSYESAKLPLTDAAVRRICSGFPDLNPEWLIDGIPPMILVNKTTLLDSVCAQYHLDTYGRLFLETFLSLPDVDRQSFSRFVVQLTANVQHLEDEISSSSGSTNPSSQEGDRLIFFRRLL